MEQTMLWKIIKSDNQKLDVEKIEGVQETETEYQLEEIITRNPDILMEDLKLIGRQTETPGGPLDLLGVDSDGRLVVFELKRGTLTREAVAQIIDYSSYLATLDPDEFSEHVSSRSGNLGIDKIDSFQTWYQEEFGKNFIENQRPRMILVGLGADERTKRMVSFLSESDLDISLTTFHGFKRDNETFLAKQVEVSSKPPDITTAFTKKSNIEKLKRKVRNLGIEDYYYNISSFFRDKIPAAYEWPNQGGYSYFLPELTETGTQSSRVYVALYIHDSKPGRVQVYLHSRAITVAMKDFQIFEESIPDRINKRNDGSWDIWVNSSNDWENLKPYFEGLCPAIVSGWKQKREKQSQEEFEDTGSSSSLEDQAEK